MHLVDIGILYSIGMATSGYGITEEQRVALGHAIHEAMKLRQVNQVELAEALNTTQSVISQWRYGKFLCPPNAVFALEEALQLPPGWLSRHFNFAPLPSDRNSGASEIETAVLQDPDLSDADKAVVLAVVKQFRETRRAMAAAQATEAPAAKAPRTRKAAAKPVTKARVKPAAAKATKAAAPRRRVAKSAADA